MSVIESVTWIITVAAFVMSVAALVRSVRRWKESR